ncbi:tRNA-dihydrouridine synthase [Haloplanus halophilus]|uniref:tRNA-dihydrouridine synthase n=1 Tax=Haloplanus halophilus TaxID=2949993 RepID=UPI0020415E98|nr:tRNA-dihydrouridine synthase [Haloplanus sp. GDY1]
MLALASLSGASDAEWARDGAAFADLALLGGLAVDDASRDAARDLVARGRREFLPDDPLAFADAELAALSEAPIRPGLNVRSATLDPVREAAAVCARHDAVVEINAHCRQEELCAAGCGERLLRDTGRLERYVAAASEAGATVSVKVRAEVDGVDLPETARRVAAAGADAIHVDAMDSEEVIAAVAAASDAVVVANNGVRDRATAWEYLAYGADGVSVGRPSDDPAVLRRVARAVDDWWRRAAEDGATLDRERERDREPEVPG